MQKSNCDDPKFLEAFLRGEEEAFDQLFREYFSALCLFANKIIQCKSDAEDIVQDSFVRLWDRRNKLPHIESIKSYLYTSIRYQCERYLAKKVKPVSGKELIPNLPPIEELIIRAETARELYKTIKELSPRHQQVIQLYYLEGRSSREISEILQIETDSVRQLKLRALLALRKSGLSSS